MKNEDSGQNIEITANTQDNLSWVKTKANFEAEYVETKFQRHQTVKFRNNVLLSDDVKYALRAGSWALP